MSTSADSASHTGAHLIAASLRALGVTTIFGIVGIPVIEVAEACIALGIKFISFRNEQAASYAASAYGYLTGRPGVCLVVGGPGVLHAMAGVGNSVANATYPLLLLAGSAESTAPPTKGAFQQLDQVAFLAPHTKLSLRPPSLAHLPSALRDAYQASFYGRPGAAYVDLPADYIQASIPASSFPAPSSLPPPVAQPPTPVASPPQIAALAQAFADSKAPLIVIGKGAAYARAEDALRDFVDATGVPFLPTPQGKGVLPDSHALNTSAARSTALAGADLVLLLGARLNWILHFGTRFSAHTRVAQVDICPLELNRRGVPADAALAITGDVRAVVSQLLEALRARGYTHPSSSAWLTQLRAAGAKNAVAAKAKEDAPTPRGGRLSYHRAFALIQAELLRLSADKGAEGLVYVSEGANTMDISRSIFAVEAPRQRLDAGTYATMGVGLGYAIAAQCVYGPQGKRVVAIEGDSAVGFSLAEIETMSRYRMPVVVFVMNNGGVYHGISPDDRAEGAQGAQGGEEAGMGGEGGEGGERGEGGLGGWGKLWENDARRAQATLPSTALGFETGYDIVAAGLGGRGWRVESEEELRRSVREAWSHRDGPSVVNVLIRSGKGGSVKFNWMGKGKAKL